MTAHRLIRCDLTTLCRAVSARADDVELHAHQRGHRAWATWSSRLAHHDLRWTLQVERGANGVLVHLSARPSRGLLCHVGTGRLRTVTNLLSSRALAELARSLETTEAVDPLGHRTAA